MIAPCEYLTLYMKFTSKGITDEGFQSVSKEDYLIMVGLNQFPLTVGLDHATRCGNFTGDGSTRINCWDLVSSTGAKKVLSSHQETNRKFPNQILAYPPNQASLTCLEGI